MKQKVGLVLGGGGARGLCHIGVLKFLDENNLKVSAIAGCSFGAIIGTMYASKLSAKEIESYITKLSLFNMLDFTMESGGLIKGKKIIQLMETKTKCSNFNKLAVPMYINTVNLNKRKEVVFTKKNNPGLLTAVQASFSMPGYFVPVKINDELYIDGGIYNNVPYSSLPKGYKKVLIIDPGLYTDKQNISKSAMNITYESIKAMQYKLVEKELEKINQNKK